MLPQVGMRDAVDGLAASAEQAHYTKPSLFLLAFALCWPLLKLLALSSVV